MKEQKTIANQKLYILFYILSALSYIGWLLLLSSCQTTPVKPKARQVVFEGFVWKYQGSYAIENAEVIISRAEVYEQLIDELINPIHDTIPIQNDGTYKVSLPYDPKRNYYKVRAYRENLLYRAAPFSNAKHISISPTPNADTLFMGTPASLKLQVANSRHASLPSLLIRMSSNIDDTQRFTYNAMIHQLFNLQSDTSIIQTYYYEDDPVIGIDWEFISGNSTAVHSEFISMVPTDTVVIFIP